MSENSKNNNKYYGIIGDSALPSKNRIPNSNANKNSSSRTGPKNSGNTQNKK